MADQLQNLLKIGQEGFFAVEQLYNGGGRPESRPPTLKNPHKNKKRGDEAPPRSIDCKEAAKKYGGLLVIDAEYHE